MGFPNGLIFSNYFFDPSTTTTTTMFLFNFAFESLLSHTHTHKTLYTTHRSAAEELVRSQFSAFKNMPSPGIQLERRITPQRQMGGSTASLNRLPDQMSTSFTLTNRNSSSISDLSDPNAPREPPSPPVQVHLPMPVKTGSNGGDAADTATVPSRGSKFAPANIFKSFFK